MSENIAMGSSLSIETARAANFSPDRLETDPTGNFEGALAEAARTQTDAPLLAAGPKTAEPIPDGRWDPAYDGAVIGEGGRAYPANVNLAEVPPVRPRKGTTPPSGESLIFVGGITRGKDNVAGLMQWIANDTGATVHGVHNSTAAIDPQGITGAIPDVVEAGDDYHEMLSHRSGLDLRLFHNGATDSLADKIEHELLSGKPVNILAESQGALITSNALARVEDRLLERYGYERIPNPFDRGQAERNREAIDKARQLLGNVTVVTFNGAASWYPDGPRYTHIRNIHDNLVANPLGQGQIGAYGGAGARHILIREDNGNPMANHVFHELWPDLSAERRRTILDLN